MPAFVDRGQRAPANYTGGQDSPVPAHALTRFRNSPGRRSRRLLWLGLFSLPVVAIAVVVNWPAAGRALSLLLDRIFTIAVPTPEVNKVAYDGDFHIGDLSLTSGTLNNYPFNFALCTNASNMIVLKSGRRSFLLGPRTNPVDPSGRPDIDFVPEHGDTVSLRASRSLVGWPTPFEVNWMTRTPSWKRYVYYRLIWKKRSGAELSMLWRYEQDYFSGRGWIVPAMMWDSHTGLLRVDIHL